MRTCFDLGRLAGGVVKQANRPPVSMDPSVSVVSGVDQTLLQPGAKHLAHAKDRAARAFGAGGAVGRRVGNAIRQPAGPTAAQGVRAAKHMPPSPEQLEAYDVMDSTMRTAPWQLRAQLDGYQHTGPTGEILAAARFGPYVDQLLYGPTRAAANPRVRAELKTVKAMPPPYLTRQFQRR